MSDIVLTDEVAGTESVDPSDRRGGLIYERMLPASSGSVARMRHELIAVLARQRVREDRLADIDLVFIEAAHNAVDHAYRRVGPGPLYTAASLAGGRQGDAAPDRGPASDAPSTLVPEDLPSPSTTPRRKLHTVTGTVSEGVERGCLLLTSGDGVYLLLGGDPALTRPGRRVTVVGEIVEGLATTCQQGTPLKVHSVVQHRTA